MLMCYCNIYIMLKPTYNIFYTTISKLLLMFPASKTLTFMWNFGSILGILLLFQLLTGIILTTQYKRARDLAFSSVQYIIYEVNGGWFVRIAHFNGARFLFIFIYAHFFKGLYFFSYRLKIVWIRGLFMLILFIGVAFLGYVLVWSQIRFWAGIVITSLLGVIPYVREILLHWVWGGFGVNNSTLGVFYTLHFLLPFISLGLLSIHLFRLHITGRTSLLFCHGDYDKVPFYPYFIVKDMVNITWMAILILFILLYPFFLGDREMFIEANPLVSPVHIVPEWYFLFAYAILRAVPNKALGVLALLLSITAYFGLPWVSNYVTPLDEINQYVVSSLFFRGVLLTWAGQCHVEAPFIFIRRVVSCIYFMLVGIIYILNYSNKVL